MYVDPVRFREAFKKRDVTLREASAKCGLTDCYLSNQTTKYGYIAKSAAILLETLFNMPESEYCVLKASEMPQSIVIDYDRLYETIKKATYEGTMKAHEDWQTRKLKEQSNTVQFNGKREVASAKS